MAFSFSQSNGFNAVDLIKYVRLREDTELAANECKPILLVNPEDNDLTLTLNLENRQGFIVINLIDDMSFTIANTKSEDTIPVKNNAVIGCVLDNGFFVANT